MEGLSDGRMLWRLACSTRARVWPGTPVKRRLNSPPQTHGVVNVPCRETHDDQVFRDRFHSCPHEEALIAESLQIIISETDMNRLERSLGPLSDTTVHARAKLELAHAEVVPSREIPTLW